MKSFKILFTFAFVLCFGMSYAQIVVTTSNSAVVGGAAADAGVANLKTLGSGELELALDAASGNADFSYQITGQTRAQLLYNRNRGGIDVRIDPAGTGNAGLPGTAKVAFFDGNDKSLSVAGNINANAMLFRDPNNPERMINIADVVTEMTTVINELRAEVAELQAQLDEN